MLKEQAEGNEKRGIVSSAEALELGYAADREPSLGFDTSSWSSIPNHEEAIRPE